MNTIEPINSSSFRANIRCATFQPLTQHVSITNNNIETNIHLQTSRSLNRVKQYMLLVLKTIHAQHCCALNGKMKVKKVADKSMMSNLVQVKRHSLFSATMSSFCYQNLNNISNGGVSMKMSKFNKKKHINNTKLKKGLKHHGWGSDEGTWKMGG